MNFSKYYENKAWSPNTILIIGFILSFLPASILHALNQKTFGNPNNVKTDIIFSFALFIIVITISYLFFHIKYVRSIVLLVNMGYTYYLYKDQHKYYQEYIINGGQKASLLFPFIISLSFIIITFITFYTIDVINAHLLIRKLETASLLFNQNKYADAEKHFKEIKTDFPDLTTTSMHLSLIYLETKRYEESYKELLYLKHTFPNNQDVIDFIKAYEKDFNIIVK